MRNHVQPSIYIITLLFVAACGGGGSDDGVSGGGGTPWAPTVSLGFQSVKTFLFTWTDVVGETEYRLLENSDGASGFSVVATIAADSTQHALQVPLYRRLNARYMLEACNSAGCTASSEVSVSGTLERAIGYFKASNTAAGDWFGNSVALAADGDTLAVGANGEDSGAADINGDESDNSATQAGAVYVFTRSAGSWAQQAYLKASNTEAGDQFGWSVALAENGDTLAVGAVLEASSSTGVNGDESDNGATGAGAVYIFTRSAGAWAQQAYLKASNTGLGDHFGYSVALAANGDTLAVGAPLEASSTTGVNGDESDNSATGAGAVYVFTRSAGIWVQQAYLKASNTDTGDIFSVSVALAADGDTLAVGAFREDSNTTGDNGDESDNSATDAGAVYVFTRSAGAWAQQAYLKASNTNAGDEFGLVALAADGDTLAVGAYLEASIATGVGGDESDNSAAQAGAVYVFTRSASTWTQQAYIKASNTDAGDQFGYSVALAADGDTLAIGARGEASTHRGVNAYQDNNQMASAGAVYVFIRSANVWTQQAYLKATRPGSPDWFGQSIALAADGDMLAVGAVNEDSASIGVGGSDGSNSADGAGAVYLY